MYVLILIIIAASGTSIETAEFTSVMKCNAAAEAVVGEMQATYPRLQIKASCFQK